MNIEIRHLMAMSCFIPALIGIFKLRRVDSRYHLFIFMMVADMVTEIVNYVSGHDRFVNIYLLLTFITFLFFVKINHYISKGLLEILLIAGLVINILNWIFNGFFSDPSYYQICFVSIVILYVSIEILSRQIFAIKGRLVHNFWFWFSISCILSYGYALLLFGLYLFALRNTPTGNMIGGIWSFVNLSSYLLFSIAILKIPIQSHRQHFIRKAEYN